MAAQADRGVPLSTLCPKYLHSNSTSHTWPFSAIAELIDNAYDPDVSAKQFWIDKTLISGQHCLIFMDNGKGLDLKTMHKMLSFGYSDKTAANGFQPIGIYGNGFKSGSMRLGTDAIVFSKSQNALCVGMLSQTYLKEIGAQQIIVPIICFEQMEPNIFSVSKEHQPSLQDILRYSPFKSEAELLTEVNIITSTWPSETTGTRIIIWNLRRTSTTESEFDFQKDRYDIRIPSEVYEGVDPLPGRAQGTRDTSTPESRYSLRAYCSILYLKPRMQIIIRGQKVKSQLVKKSLAYVMKDSYKPFFLPRRVPIIFGYNTRSKDQYGIMMYHKNRLIKAYERVGCQLKGNYQGVGVIGVIECNFLEPTHNKQSFMDTDRYRRTMTNLATKLDDYWKEMVYKRKREDPNSTIPVEDTTKRPDQNWVQCDDCLKWRKLPDGIDCSKLPEKWSCHMNPDPQFRSCQVDAEPEDSDDEQTTYPKTYKIQERKEKQRVAEQKQREEDMRRRQQQECLASLTKRNQALQRQLRQTQEEQQLGFIRRKEAVNPQHENQRGRRSQSTAKSPGIPTTPKSRLNSLSAQGGAAGAESTPQISSVVSQAACSVPTKDGLPVIASVCSLSPVVTGKRTKLHSPETTPKRPRLNGHHQGTPNASTIPDVSPLRPQPVGDNGNDTDDDLIIMETVSTPKPKDPGFDLAKVKSEDEQSNCSVSLLVELGDDADTTDALHTSGAEAACEASRPPDTASITTQTEVPKIKEESESGKDEGRKEVTLQSGDAASAAATTTTATTTATATATAALNQGEETEASVADTPGTPDIPELCQSSKEAQEQQDWLLELMQATALERDELKRQLHQLTCQLQDAQSRLQAPPPVSVKKECSHQGVQTEERAPEEDYKDLFERARQRVDELIRDKQDLLAAREADEVVARAKEDTFTAEVQSLAKELEQREREREEMRSQLDKLSAQCEELQQQQRDMTKEGSSAQQNPGTSTSGTALDMSRSLMQLRQNIGQLLVPFVPALDLGQVNFECNVIDEILEQVVSNPEIVAAIEQRLEAINGQT